MAKLEELETRVGVLEKKLDDFLLRVKVLNWFAGILGSILGVVLAVFGFSYKGIVAQVADTIVNDATGKVMQSIEGHVEQANKADLKLEDDIERAGHISGHSDVPVNRPLAPGQLKHDGGANSHPAVAQSRTQRQINAMKESLNGTTVQVYTTQTLANDVGQLTNCVAVYIEDLEAHSVNADYGQGNSEAIYQQIYALAIQLRDQVGVKDTQSKPDDHTWHSFGWFDQFQQGLTQMQLAHKKAGALGESDLDDWKGRFLNLRNGMLGSSYTGPWPATVN